TLYKEMVARLKPDDASVPVLDQGYFYGSRFEPAREYPIHFRRKGKLTAPEEILIDGNARAKGHTYYGLGDYEVSPDNRVLAWSEDTVSRRQYRILFRDLATGKELPDVIDNADPDFVWSADAKSLLYVEKDPKTLLGNKVRQHVMGTPVADDALVFENDDETYYMGLRASKSREYLFIDLDATEQSETLFVRNDGKSFDFRPVLAREDDHEYQVEHLGDAFIVRSNWQAPNFRLMRAPIASSRDKGTWKEIVAHDAKVYLDSYDVFATHLVVNERSGGLKRIRITPWSGGEGVLIGADDPVYTMSIDDNRELASTTLRYRYSALTTPGSTFEVDLATGKRTLLKRDFAGEDFDPARYSSEFVWISARDGAKVPVSLLYRVGTKRDGTAPSLIYSYGSYGISSDPAFRGNWISLVDRGFVVAIPHIRGGQEMGREWYEQGRLLNKKNTFTDFIDATRALVEQKIIAKNKVFAEGGSAGGLLMGAVANMAPQDYRGIIAHVPFVDVVTTMLDESIPLTTNEFDEWGNPKQKAFYDYMLSYSPYDNVHAQDYPAILVLTGLHDSQVQYWEPAKWVARLRRFNTGDAPILFRTQMEAGHGGASGRFKRFEDTALAYAFVLDQAGMADVKPADLSNENLAGGMR
ncbi:MAG: S9 family peptidase, partial [Lysobacterales bacterium]